MKLAFCLPGFPASTEARVASACPARRAAGADGSVLWLGACRPGSSIRAMGRSAAEVASALA